MTTESNVLTRRRSAAIVIAAVLGTLLVSMAGFMAARAQRGGDGPARTVAEPDGDRNGADAPSTAECMRSVREIYGALTAVPAGDSAIAYRCRVEVIPADSTVLRHSTTDLDVLCSAGRLRVTSSVMSVERDSVDVFAVVPEAHTVFRSDGRAGLPSTGPSLDLAAMRDSLIERSAVAACSERVDSAGHRLRTVQLQLDAAARRSYGLRGMTLVLDMNAARLTTMTMVPEGDREIRAIVWAFSPVRTTAAPEDLRAPAARRFLGRGDRLLAEWRGFRLEDHRGGRPE